MPSVFIDEVLSSQSIVRPMLDEIDQAKRSQQERNGRATDNQDNSSSSDAEFELTEDEIRDFKERKKRLMAEYQKRLVLMREEERTRAQEILR